MEPTTELFDETKKYLIGPYSDDEILPEHPDEFYISGLLFPKQIRPSSEDFETFDVGSDDDDGPRIVDESRHSSSWMLPNSLGLRCNLAPEIAEIEAEVSFARYVPEELGWRRIPFTKKILVRVDEEKEKEIVDNDKLIAKLSWKVDTDRNNSSPTYKMLSIFLSNEQDEPDAKNENGEKQNYLEIKNIRNQRILFQPEIKLNAEKEKTFLGTDISCDRRSMLDEELSLEMLYRQRIVYGQGYNCSADWNRTNNNPSYVKTELLPQYQSKQIVFSSDEDENRLDLIDMTDLDEAETPEDVYELLKYIPEKYSKWIDNLPAFCSDIEPGSDYENVANDNQKKCQETLERIRNGLQILKDPNHGDVFKAFKITNRTMLYQRVHYKFSIDKTKGKQNLPRTPDTRKKKENYWRPFQLAFLLMNIRGMSDTVSDDGLTERKSVDLLWFPTGGGKTEAYLALSAFSLVLRRMRREGTDGSGVSVIMRYTLRLLTIQQFERAATLICALEIFRRKDRELLGNEPFLIGLWVGWNLTPNSWRDSKNSLQKLSRNEIPETGSPVQLVFCPWCGHDINHRNYQVDDRTKWTIVHCMNPGCEFYHSDKLDTSLALPVLTVDFDIYRRCPSILIATVDKFARVSWKPETSSLFGIVERKCERCGFLTNTSTHPEGRHNERWGRSLVKDVDRLQPPDLIIQDELHLITGPIGTMVGLYETAVDYLCSWNIDDRRLKPKIVVSTATVKGVETQIKRLFNRNSVKTFPPPGVTFGDTFFWWESETRGRKYVGVSHSHRSMKFALGRLYAILLQRIFEIRESSENPEEVDPYWTLVGYFNSVRELGGAIRLVEDDVKSNISKIISLLSTHNQRPERQIGGPVELTGRVKGQEIREIRKRLEMNSKSDQSIDVLLATNMISVGIDIDRLGLMVVNGQTKGASEYIQVTGRVGRRENVPGIVFTLYNPYKPRDLSHYENFVGDHLTLQKSVEPVGLTPFSDRAMDRAMHAILLGMIRPTIPNLSRNADADSFRLGNTEVQKICQFILERFSSVQNVDENHDEYQRVSNKLQQFLDNWNQYIDDSHRKGTEVFYLDDSTYDRFGSVPKKLRILMTDFASKDVSDSEGFPKPTPGSLRDVETGANMFYEG